MLVTTQRVHTIDINEITANPHQPRHDFDEDGLVELRDSILVHGILQPLSVRKTTGGYTLIAGERRLRAAKLAGLNKVPCLILRADESESEILALLENLQRRDLNCFEEAAAMARLSARGMTQEAIARQLGKSQSAIANKLRLLNIPEDIQREMAAEGLTERHARALLRLPEEQQRRVLSLIVEKKLTVAQTEEHIDRLIRGKTELSERSKTTFVVKDVRLFLNTVDRAVNLMRQSGVGAQMQRRDEGDVLVLTVRIPKTTMKRR